MSPAQIEQAGVLHVFQRALYQMPERKPQTDGVLDPRLVRAGNVLETVPPEKKSTQEFYSTSSNQHQFVLFCHILNTTLCVHYHHHRV